MKVIIAGSRDLYGMDLVEKAVAASPYKSKITMVIEGEAPGIDVSAKQWATRNSIMYMPFPAKWDKLTEPDAFIKTHENGTKYDARAGFRRNEQMANEGEALIAIMRKGKPTRGTSHMIQQMKNRHKPIFIYWVE